MTRRGVSVAAAWERLHSLPRLLSCIRVDEVVVLQGTPVIGALFAMAGFGATTLSAIAMLVAGNVCLVAHVFVLNDWAGIGGDLEDPNRAAHTFVARGENAAHMGALALILLALAVAIFSMVGWATLAIALLIAALSASYSLAPVHGKGVPLLSSALHLVGGLLHFLLGYSALSPLSLPAVAIGCYFGLVFAAGHLTHETRDHDGDLRNRIRTNAVAFGKRRAFLAGLLLFTLAYLLLCVLALCGVVHIAFLLAVAAYAVHLRAALRALRAGLTYSGIRRLQTIYRNIHLVIGVALLATVPPW